MGSWAAAAATSNQALAATAAAGTNHLAALTPPLTGQCWPGVSGRPAGQQGCAGRPFACAAVALYAAAPKVVAFRVSMAVLTQVEMGSKETGGRGTMAKLQAWAMVVAACSRATLLVAVAKVVRLLAMASARVQGSGAVAKGDYSNMRLRLIQSCVQHMPGPPWDAQHSLHLSLRGPPLPSTAKTSAQARRATHWRWRSGTDSRPRAGQCRS